MLKIGRLREMWSRVFQHPMNGLILCWFPTIPIDGMNDASFCGTEQAQWVFSLRYYVEILKSQTPVRHPVGNLFDIGLPGIEIIITSTEFFFFFSSSSKACAKAFL